MRALDTNILARYAVGDDPEQARLAAEVLAGPCFVPDTVLLETAWLLSSRFKQPRAIVADTLRDLLQMPQLSVNDAERIHWAIDRFAAGADFADMIHIAGSLGADSFISFEKRLARIAGPDAPLPIEALG